MRALTGCRDPREEIVQSYHYLGLFLYQLTEAGGKGVNMDVGL
jgi:hypothetical protein